MPYNRFSLLGMALFSAIFVPILSYAEIIENFENKWQMHSSLLQCEMQYELPGFAEVFFTKKSGVELGFTLQLLSPSTSQHNKKQELILYIKNPDWVDSGRMMVLGSVVYQNNNQQAIVLPTLLEAPVLHKKKYKNKANYPSIKWVEIQQEPKFSLSYDLLTPLQLWQALESGNSIVFHAPHTNQTQLISAVGFRETQKKYQHCLSRMIPYDFDTLKLTRLYFPTSSAALTEEHKEMLNIIIEQIFHDEYISKIELSGHTDIVGGYTDNRLLSNRRLWAVKDYLVLRGVPIDLIEARGYGDLKPIAPHNTKAGRAKNRRVEVKLTH